MVTARKALFDYLAKHGIPPSQIAQLLGRAITEGRYVGDTEAPYIGVVDFKLRCGTRDIVFQRQSGGIIQVLLFKFESNQPPDFSAQRIDTKEKFDTLWECLSKFGSPLTAGTPEKIEPTRE